MRNSLLRGLDDRGGGSVRHTCWVVQIDPGWVVSAFYEKQKIKRSSSI